MEAKIKSKTKTIRETEKGVITTYAIAFEGEEGDSFVLATEKKELFDEYPQGADVKIDIKSLQKKLGE